MNTLNIKTVTSAVAALGVVLLILSVTFFDATKMARDSREAHGFVAYVSALVR